MAGEEFPPISFLPSLHPSGMLALCLYALLLIQFYAVNGLILLLLLALSVHRRSPGVFVSAVWRLRWLFLSLWLVLAFQVPGEEFLPGYWGPTYEGLHEANVHALRLLVSLACLSLLRAILGQEGLIAGLAGLLAPWRAFGGGVDLFLVRLHLVLTYLQGLSALKGDLAASGKLDWRAFLRGEVAVGQGSHEVQISIFHWRTKDLVWVLVLGGVLTVGVRL